MQVLKKEQRQAIISAATAEFLANGYDKASMRAIADKAGMAAGNLYRYFPDKEALCEYIVADTWKQIEDLLNRLSADTLSMETRVFSIRPDVSDLYRLLDEFVEELTDIYWHNQDQFNILLADQKASEQMKQWFARIITSLVEQHFLFTDLYQEKYIMIDAYATAIVEGMRNIFRSPGVDKENMTMMIRMFIKSYVYLLDSDLKPFMQ